MYYERYIPFGEVMEEIRVDKGISAEKMASGLKISVDAYYRLETSRKMSFDAKLMETIAKLLSYSLEYIIRLADRESTEREQYWKQKLYKTAHRTGSKRPSRRRIKIIA